jgi:hypothetical protein
MLFSTIVPVYSQKNIKHLNAARGQNAETFSAKARGTYRPHQALWFEGYLRSNFNPAGGSILVPQLTAC